MRRASSIHIYIKSVPHLPYSVIVESTNNERRLLFESGHIFEMFANEFKPVKKQYAKVANKYFGCLGILNLNSPNQVHQYLILVKSAQFIDNIGNTSIYRIQDISTVALQDERREHIRLDDIRKLLSNGQFYLSRYADIYTETTPNLNNMQTCIKFDITSSLQRRYKTGKSDNMYFWNKILFLPFVRYNIDMGYWLDKIICGYIDIKKIKFHENFESTLCLVSRIATVLPGFKFPMHGLSDAIQTANAVETEQVLYINRSFTSYVQLRGCTPLFWEQLSEDLGSQRIQLTRGYELTHQTFTKYLEMLHDHYNGDITMLNLLTEVSREMADTDGAKDAETFLSHEYYRHYSSLPSDIKRKTQFLQYDVIRDGDLSEFPDNIPKIHELFLKNLNLEEVFLWHGGDVMTEQKNFIRSNCFDCLNRTNRIQLYIATHFLNRQLMVVSKEYADNFSLQLLLSERFRSLLQPMWLKNGMELAKFFVSITTSEFLNDMKGKFDLTDSSTFEAINLFLSSTPVNRSVIDRAINIVPPVLLTTCTDDVLRQICLRSDEFSRLVKLQVGIGTFNANGTCLTQIIQKEHMIQKWLTPLLPMSSRKSRVCDIYAIGFQDIVDINISPLITTNLVDDNIKLWCIEIEEVLNKTGKYSLITYCQLMGICLFLFIKEKYITFVKHVSFDCIKTAGYNGMLESNKGAVAIRFAFCETTMCFICAHFTDGQDLTHERNKDFQQIMNSIHFPCASSVNSHDYIFFLGDLNYRIDLDNAKIRGLIRFKQYEQLLRNDQLLVNKKANIIFQGFQEGQINFSPTYKYNLNSNIYDTSINAQSPAWCDRILWKFNPPHKFFRTSKVDNLSSQSFHYGYPGQSMAYGRIESKISDHRPVFSVNEIGVKRFIPKCFEIVFNSVIKENGPLDSTISLKVQGHHKLKISEPEFVYKVLEKLSNFGQVVMVRFCFNIMLATFAKPWFALSAISMKSINISGITLTLSIRDPQWDTVGHKEIEFCIDDYATLFTSELSFLDGPSMDTPRIRRAPSKSSKHSSSSFTARTLTKPKMVISSPMGSISSKTGSTKGAKSNIHKNMNETNIFF